MPQNRIDHPGIAALADAIAESTQLNILDLNDSTVTKKCSQSIAKVCCFASSLGKEYDLCLVFTRGGGES